MVRKKQVQKKIKFILGDIRDYDSVNKAMKGCQNVMHLAALIGIPYSYISPTAYIKTNVEGTLNVFESAKNLKLKQVIVTSTSEVYGTAIKKKLSENDELKAQSPYAASKIAADQLSLSYYRSFRLPVKIIAKSQGITNFYISINYLGYKIKKYLGDGSKLGVKIKYLEEKKPLGTAGSISLIKKFNKPIFIMNADIVSKIDFREMVSFHKKKKSPITVAAKVFRQKDNYGRIIASGSIVKRVIEKLEKNILINAGIYMIDPIIKKFIKNSQYLDMTDLINRTLKRKIKINVFPIYEKWLDYSLKKNIKNNK